MFGTGAGLGRGQGSDIGSRRCREGCRVGLMAAVSAVGLFCKYERRDRDDRTVSLCMRRVLTLQ